MGNGEGHVAELNRRRPLPPARAGAKVAQSISAAHQFLIEGMFARADAQKVKRLLDEPVGHLGILTQTAGQSLLARTERAGFLADEQARDNA